MGNALTAAVRLADLPSILERHYPAALTRGFRVRPVWRGSSDASAALKRFKDGAWVLTDFSSGQSWNAYEFLVDLCSYSPRDAAAWLIGATGVTDETRSPTRASPAQPVSALEGLPDFPLEVLQVMRLDRLYFGGRLVHDTASNAVTLEGRALFLEPLADWLSDCVLVLGLGQPRVTQRGQIGASELTSSRGCSQRSSGQSVAQQPVSVLEGLL